MYSVDDIISFVREQTGTRKEKIDIKTDIFNDLGVAGDDCDELMGAYSKKFNVDLSSYLWYFHCGEEGSWNSIGGIFFKPPNTRVARIPITPLILLQAANEGNWNVKYPSHQLPQFRYDIAINRFLVLTFFSYLLYRLIVWLFF